MVKLSRSKAKAVSAVCADIGQVWFGAFVAVLILPLDAGKVLVLLLYVGFSVFFWLLSALFAEKGKL